MRKILDPGNSRTISVVIPAYNCAGSITECIRSVLEQTVPPFEVIIIDDCSSDATVTMIKSINDVRLKLICLELNSGAQAARNAGIREARGGWIAFQDADDVWLPEKLEKQITCLEDVEYDEMTVVHTDVFWTGKAHKDDLLVTLPLVNGDRAMEVLLRGPGPLLQTMLTSRKALVSIGYLDEAVPAYHEWDTAICLAAVCRFIHVREPLVRYNRQPGSISSDGKRDLEGYHYVLEKHADLIWRFCGETVWKEHARNQAVRAMAFGFWDEAAHFLKWNGYGDWRYIVLKLLSMAQITPGRFMRCAAYMRRIISGGVTL